ncbi:tetratricopeptide repeat protein [Hymenobacter sp. BRD67]|uniref:tetratricopeptide repeat protein n=1 Tax=Hymenobacter sp. BRD67 TaxID=2675877 RepID=UPI001563199D|nr:tetratricopeptide repeat protein [Hymenobacter sp. BRD67]QKG51483.1 tetratricopeptide repeat protein [Hymenobacter sp. BRD67]
MASISSTSTHQLLLLAGALALAGGLYALPKGIVKPKEGKSALNRDAARTANRDGGGMATSGSKADASSGPRPAETGSVAGEAAPAANAPHTQATAAQRQELNTLLAQYRAASTGSRRQVATTLAARYSAVERFDSAGYYLAAVAATQPSEKAWQQAADAYFQAYSFAASAERKKMLGDKARELYDKVLAANPNNLDAKTNLGMAYMSSDNPVKGIGLLREVLEQDPKNEKVLYNLGILAIQSNQLDKAVERFSQLVQVNPKNVNGQFYLGVVLARTNRGIEARAAFQKAKSLSADPALAASVDEELAKLRN